jgi:ATP adenylyltransferase
MDLRSKFEEVRHNGQLIFYESEYYTRFAKGITFVVRYCPALRAKGSEGSGGGGGGGGGGGVPRREGEQKRNPFLPPEPALKLAALEDTHTLLFNKYCVVPKHLLLISNDFVRQEEPLEFKDFVACERTLDMLDDGGWLFFYNSGKESGASQSHRHLQLIPDDKPPVTASFVKDGVSAYKGMLHGLVRIADDGEGVAGSWYEAYDSLRKILPAEDTSYSMLFTRTWMLMIPRRRERYEGISFNSLAFAGYILACHRQDFDFILHQSNPIDILKELAFPS